MLRKASVFVVVSLAGALFFFVGQPASAEPVTETFDATGEEQTFVVPDDVCQVHIEAFGAEGGAGAILAAPTAQDAQEASPSGRPTTADPGLGGHATADATVTPGQSLTVIVGGQGAAADAGGGGGFGGGGDGGV